MDGTGYSREEIERYLKSARLSYQRIELPYGLATPGPDRSETANAVFPADLRGQSVLDVGCFLGYFCHEAKRRGASEVVGVDSNPERLGHARQLADMAGYDITFRAGDIEVDELAGRFDVVLGLNILHHLRDPLGVLQKLVRACRRQLVIEVAGLSEPPMRRYLKELGLPRRKLRALEELPLIGVGRGGASPLRERRFFFTGRSVENILTQHQRTFANVRVTPSAKQGRTLVVAERRRIERLVLFAGPTGVGKSRLIQGVMDNTGDLGTRLGIETPSSWASVQADDLGELREPAVSGLIFRYDLLRYKVANYPSIGHDEALDLLDCSGSTTVYTLICSLSLLRARVRERLLTERDPGSIRNLEVALRIYDDPTRVRQVYEAWADLLASRGLMLQLIDTATSAYEPRPAEALHGYLAA